MSETASRTSDEGGEWASIMFPEQEQLLEAEDSRVDPDSHDAFVGTSGHDVFFDRTLLLVFLVLGLLSFLFVFLWKLPNVGFATWLPKGHIFGTDVFGFGSVHDGSTEDQEARVQSGQTGVVDPNIQEANRRRGSGSFSLFAIVLLCGITLLEGVFGDGNRLALAYPHRTGFRPMPDAQSRSQCLSSSPMQHSPCHRVMSV